MRNEKERERGGGGERVSIQKSSGHVVVEPSLHLGSLAMGARHSGHVVCLSNHCNTQSSQNMCWCAYVHMMCIIMRVCA